MIRDALVVLSWMLVIVVAMSVFTFLAFFAGHLVEIALRFVGAAP